MAEKYTDMNDLEQVKHLNKTLSNVRNEISKVIIGQKDTIEHLLITLLAKGHCLIIGVPGLAKTKLIETLSSILDLRFNRIQFTPDLMPSDITGTEVLEEDKTTGQKAFKFVKGPVFANIILADEINRTPPKTQSALLEAMQEHSVTIAGEGYTLEEPFFVLATQNPIEQEGTYPLPEAQLDRFMFNLWMNYPSKEEEIDIVKTTTSAYQADLKPVLNAQDIINFQNLVRRVPVAENVIEYAVKLVALTRPDNNNAPDYVKEWLSWGAGPRASQYLILGAKAKAIMDGRPSPDIDDVKGVTKPVLRHRLVTSFTAEAEGVDTLAIINKLLQEKNL